MQGKFLVNRFQTAVKATNQPKVQSYLSLLILILQTSLNQNKLKFILGFDFVMLQLSQVSLWLEMENLNRLLFGMILNLDTGLLQCYI